MATTTENTDNVPSKIIKLESNDGKIFEIDQDILDQLSALKELTETLGIGDAPIPIPKVNAAYLASIIEFCKHHKNDAKTEKIDDDEDDDPNKDMYEPKRSDDMSEWDMSFIKQYTVQDGTLFEIIQAANYLGIKSLLAVGLKTIANMVHGKPSTDVRQMFNISYDPPGEGINAIENASEAASSS